MPSGWNWSKYAWLNNVQAFATGETGAGGVTYKMYVPK